MKIILTLTLLILSGCATSQLEETVFQNREESVNAINRLQDQNSLQEKTLENQQTQIQALKAKVDELTQQVKDLAYKLTQPRLISHDDIPASEFMKEDQSVPVVVPSATPEENH